MLSTAPPRNIDDMFASFGSTDFMVKQSILPVVCLVIGEPFIRCIGTAFLTSCSGYVMTACHVILDPHDRGYGKIVKDGSRIRMVDGLQMGVFIPLNSATGYNNAYRFFPFLQSSYWGEWQYGPLIHEDEKFSILTDIAICKIAEMPNGAAHQPLSLSLNEYSKGEMAYALGYVEMDDIPFKINNGHIIVDDFNPDIYVSVGEVTDLYPENHISQNVPTPGPCFQFSARIPGKMSGGPIFGADGAVVRGVVSRSYSGERCSYGAMLGPAMRLPLINGSTFKSLMESGNEGIARVQGIGL